MINNAVKIVKKLQESGFDAFFAGGYVRDLLLEKNSNDIDIVTSARPEQIEKIFKNTYPVGKKFGVMLVVQAGHNFEVATFRKESHYEDKRHPLRISFTNAKEDALRRDFTVNGMFYDPVKHKVIDFVGGQEDIKKRVIKFIGHPEKRINEDHLRLLRAIRLKTTLGFQYDKGTFEAVRKYADLIGEVSKERLRDELNKIMASSLRHQGLVELSESLILKNILPEIERLKGVPQPIEYHHEGDVFTHTYLALKSLAGDCPSHLAWAVMLHDIGKPDMLKVIGQKITFHGHAKQSATIATNILRRFKFPGYEIKLISYLVENHMKIGDIPKMRPSKKYDFLLNPWMEDLIVVARADAAGTYPKNLTLVNSLEDQVKQALDWKQRKEQEVKIKIFTGDDLIKLGFEPGSLFRQILSKLKDRIVEGEILSKEEAISFVKKNYKNE